MEKKVILLVEDDAEIRAIIKTVLERKYNILEASGYVEGMKHLKEQIDLALIDYKLPNGNGLELIKSIREMKPDLPVIMITGFGDKSLVVNALRAGVTDFIEKPLSLKYLMNKITGILDGKENDEQPDVIKNKDEFIMDCIAEYINENYMEDLKCEKIVGITNMNRSKFSKVFKKRFGQSLVSYINLIRIKNAAELLRNPDLSITEIASHVGYESITHFERVFRKVNGASPKEYRREIRNRFLH